MPFTQRGAAEAPELGTADEKVAIAEMVRQGIRKAREKLIDLKLFQNIKRISPQRWVKWVNMEPRARVKAG